MRFHFHIETKNAVYPDLEGIEFIDLDVARAYGVLLIRNFFLAHPAPRLEVLSGAVLRITCWLTTWGSRLERCRLGSA